MFIAYCPALDITSTGEDINDVVTQFYEHFQLYVECCLKDNTLIQDLQNHGWKLEGVKQHAYIPNQCDRCLLKLKEPSL